MNFALGSPYRRLTGSRPWKIGKMEYCNSEVCTSSFAISACYSQTRQKCRSGAEMFFVILDKQLNKKIKDHEKSLKQIWLKANNCEWRLNTDSNTIRLNWQLHKYTGYMRETIISSPWGSNSGTWPLGHKLLITRRDDVVSASARLSEFSNHLSQKQHKFSNPLRQSFLLSADNFFLLRE